MLRRVLHFQWRPLSLFGPFDFAMYAEYDDDCDFGLQLRKLAGQFALEPLEHDGLIGQLGVVLVVIWPEIVVALVFVVVGRLS